jgi:hypothetical protein
MRKEKQPINDENDGKFTISSNWDYLFLRYFETNGQNSWNFHQICNSVLYLC